jgi:hypothetical protein
MTSADGKADRKAAWTAQSGPTTAIRSIGEALTTGDGMAARRRTRRGQNLRISKRVGRRDTPPNGCYNRAR